MKIKLNKTEQGNTYLVVWTMGGRFFGSNLLKYTVFSCIENFDSDTLTNYVVLHAADKMQRRTNNLLFTHLQHRLEHKVRLEAPR